MLLNFTECTRNSEASGRNKRNTARRRECLENFAESNTPKKKDEDRANEHSLRRFQHGKSGPGLAEGNTSAYKVFPILHDGDTANFYIHK